VSKQHTPSIASGYPEDDPHHSETDSSAPPVLDRLRRRFIYGLAFGVLVIVALVVISDGRALARTLRDFNWFLLPAIFAFTLLNYLLRYAKWEYYLALLDIRNLKRRTSLLIFLAGLAMAITPGKVGELLKAYLIRRANGTPMAISAPIPFAERLTDGLAMLGLASLGLLVFQYGWQFLLVVGIFTLAFIVALQSRRFVYGVLGFAERIRFVRARAGAIRRLYESTYVVMRPKNLAIATGLGLVSWAGECLAFFLILIGLGMPANFEFLVLAFFVLATATILGSISMLPGGLGAAEASVAGLLLLLVQDARMTTDVAGAATLLVRIATLWLGVLIGVAALFVVERHLQSLTDERPNPARQQAVPGD
jgi:glycosyltransferase 2 family protein